MIDYSQNPHGDVVFDSMARSKTVQLRVSLSEFIRIANETRTEAEFRAEIIAQARFEKNGREVKEKSFEAEVS